jgi:hypothetical protein
LKALCDAGQVELHARMRLHSMRPQAGRIELTGEPVSGAVPRIADIDEIIVATGSRPDLGMTRELRTRHDPMIESPEALAPLIDPNIHSCGLVRALTHLDMLHPEQDYFAIGAKSYGRAPNFLMVTGYEQVRVVVEALLPGTGRAAAAAGGATADACAATQANCAA